jgi:ATP-dependent DNA ligase
VLHEIKHDGFRLMVRRDGAGIRLLTRIVGRKVAQYSVERLDKLTEQAREARNTLWRCVPLYEFSEVELYK